MDFKNANGKEIRCDWNREYPFLLLATDDTIRGLCLVVHDEEMMIRENFNPSAETQEETNRILSKLDKESIYVHDVESGRLESCVVFTEISSSGTQILGKTMHDMLVAFRLKLDQEVFLRIDVLPYECIPHKIVNSWSSAAIAFDADSYLMASLDNLLLMSLNENESSEQQPSIQHSEDNPSQSQASNSHIPLKWMRMSQCLSSISGILKANLKLPMEIVQSDTSKETTAVVYTPSGNILLVHV